MIYLDNAMTTRPSEKGVAQAIPMLVDGWGSPMAPHKKGQELFPAIAQSYREIYKLFGASEEDLVIFTSSGAEAVNHVFLSTFFEVVQSTGKNQFITSNIDEAPAMMSMHRLEKLQCVGKTAHANENGIVTRAIIADLITPRTALVSLSWGNGLTGTINEVQEIATLLQERGILFHLDATHVLGKIYFELEDIGADFITFNGDNLHAPKGTGALYVKKGAPISPFIVGGLEQGGYRAGSMNVSGLAALGQAAGEAIECRDLMCTEIARLRNELEDIPDAVVFFKDRPRLPHIAAIGFPGIVNESLLFALNRRGLCACIGGGSFQQIGLVLQASGIDETLANSAVSFCLSRETTGEEIEKAKAIITECVTELRQASSAFTGER